MAQAKSTPVVRPLFKLFGRDHVEEEARRLGVIHRVRKIDFYSLVVVLVFGFQEGAERTLASLRDCRSPRPMTRIVASCSPSRKPAKAGSRWPRAPRGWWTPAG